MIEQLRAPGRPVDHQAIAAEMRTVQGVLSRVRGLYDNEATEFLLVSEANAPISPLRSTRRFLALAVGAILSVLGVAAVVSREMLTGRIRSSDELSLKLSLPVLGVVPLLEVPDPRDPAMREAVATMAQALRRSHPGAAAVLVTGAQTRAGTTTISAGLAAALGRQHERVLLVDFGLRDAVRPEWMEALLKNPKGPGLGTLLSTPGMSPEAVVHPTTLPGVDCIPFDGVAAGSDLLAAPTFGHALAALQQKYGVIIMDAPPALQHSDACLIARWGRTAVVVARGGSSKASRIRKTVERLQAAGAQVAGVVLNCADPYFQTLGMKLLVISNLYPPHVLGGYEMLCAEVCSALHRRGHDLLVLTSTHGIDKEAPPRRESLPVLRQLELYLPFEEPPRLLRTRRWIVGHRNHVATKRVITGFHPDAIFVWSQLRLTLGPARAAFASKVPVLYVLNDEHISGYSPRPLMLSPRAIARWVADTLVFSFNTLRGLKLQHAAVNSRCVRDWLSAQGVEIADCRVIYQGIDIARFPPKAEPGSIHSPVRVLYTGQLHPYKGVHTIIRAIGLINRARGPDYLTLSVVGTGPAAYIRKLEAEASLSGARVHFMGHMGRELLAPVYREHDVFVFPSIWHEPFGLTHLEAMASGTPVVSTAHGGPGEFLRHEENALVFEKENPRDLSFQILRLIDDPKLRARIAVQGSQMVARQFTLERYVSELENYLEGLALPVAA